jgi:drug/metabolite transporter (DMT)-like permease
VLLAFLVFGEVLGAVQLLGGALVLGAVLVLVGRKRRALDPAPNLELASVGGG